jgi:hypothetical protein
MKSGLLLLGLMTLVVLSVRSQDTTCGIVWMPEVQLSEDSDETNLPHIAVSGHDTIHAIWRGGNLRQPYARSTDGGRTWSATRDLIPASPEYPVPYPYSLISSQGQRVVIFGGGDSYPKRLTFLLSEDGGTTWSAAQRIGIDSVAELVTSDCQGDTFLIMYWPIHGQIPAAARTLMSTNAGSTWFNLPDTMGIKPYVRMTRNSMHFVEAVVVNGAGEIQYMRSRDLGQSYDRIDTLTEPDGELTPERGIAREEAGNGSTIIVYWRDFVECTAPGGCTIMARESPDDGETWMPTEIYTDVPNGIEPVIAARDGRRAAVWTQETVVDVLFEIAFRMKSPDGSFCPISVIGRGGKPTVALTSTTIHVVWAKGYFPEPVRYKTYYRRGILTQFIKHVDYESGWNLVSAARKSTVSPTLASLYAFERRYERCTKMEFGRGYWAQVDSGVYYEGDPVSADTVEVEKEWNLVGSLSEPVDVNTIETQPPGILLSPFYSYDGSGYSMATTLDPGKAYWVKVSQDGEIILRTSALR